tara:strand:- start:614 stop:922 length:309 start_codon:yes stop_codon:yes gene_type:complete
MKPLISDALRLARVYWGYTQHEMAKAAGVSQSFVSEVESGRKTPSLEAINAYSKALNIRPSNLIYFAEELEGLPTDTRGKVRLASTALSILEKFAPRDPEHA